MERLAGGAARAPHEWLAEVRPAERAPADRPFVYLNMVASVDGRATLEGGTRNLGSDTDTLLLTEMRAMADAVLLGTGTVRAEGYAKLVGNEERVARRTAAGLAATPTAVLVSRSGDLPWEAGLFAAPDQSVLVYTDARGEPPDVAAAVEVVRPGGLAAVLADLRARGVSSVLCEGGPTLNRALLAEGLVDELFLTLSPLVTGDDAQPAIVAGGALPAPVRLALRAVATADGELYLRYAV